MSVLNPQPLRMSPQDLARIFNTALIGTRFGDLRSSSALDSNEISQISQSPAYQQILSAIAAHAEKENLSLVAAAEDLIRTFRKLDSFWTNYVFQEGLQKIQSD